MLKLTLLLFFLKVFCGFALAQNQDSIISDFKNFPKGYLKNINKKVTQYTHRITNKTEKTLTKLSRWENKIKGLLDRTSPETAERLFGANQLTFTSLLLQLKNGEAIASQYQAPYNKYRDDVTTSLKYLSQQKEKFDSVFIKNVIATNTKINQLNLDEDRSETIQLFIKQRKRELIEQAFQQLSKSKYFAKINKEAYYYSETLKNYKEVFSDSKKAEKTGKELLSKIPSFRKFIKQNSQLATVFSSGTSIEARGGSLEELQTRVSVQNLIQSRIAAGGPNGEQIFRQNITQAQAELGKLKSQITNHLPGAGNGGENLPDFKPDLEKTKTFIQRIEYGTNMQFSQSNKLIPGAADIGLSIGYKINEKSIIGVGGSYKLGLGSIRHIRLSGQGASIRSFVDWKLKNQFFISGGFEMNYLSKPLINDLLPIPLWQQSGLLGISKKIPVKTKWFKETKIQLLYDFLSQQHLPISQPILFRVGYNF